MRRFPAMAMLFFAACSACSGSSPTAPGADAGPPAQVDIQPPPALCDGAPAPFDVSNPTAVVGDGTPASCTQEALQAAVGGGGVVVFDCGPEPVTVTLTSPVRVTRETVLDGGGRVTLSGGGTTRILYLDSSYDLATPRLVVQRLIFRDGRSLAGGEDTAAGGAAIYRDGGSLTVINCNFLGNRAPLEGQDVAGGAIYAFGGGETVIASSFFSGNWASNGGAVGSLNGDLAVFDSLFSSNVAAGSGGNPGNGGCGGAIYQDGAEERTTLCGVTIAGNRAGAIGGGFFRVSNDNTGTMTVDRSTVSGNQTPEDRGNAGGLYLQGLQLAITASTVARNQAFYNGGLWLHTCRVQMTNVTVAENTATGSNGGGLWLSDVLAGSTLLNCTVANNRSIAQDQIAGAIFGAGLKLQNTVIAGNTAMWVPGCNEEHEDGGGNLQWPDGALCTPSLQVADPLLGALGDHGGPTETMVPAAGSPAIGLGSGCPPTDQRGRPRGTRCTAGAVEGD